MATLLSVLYCCWTSRRKPQALQVHTSNQSSTSADHIPISMGTLGVLPVASYPSVQSRPYEGKNRAKFVSSAYLSNLNKRILIITSQRLKVREMVAVTLLPPCDEIPTAEPKSPSLLPFSTLTCLILCRIKYNLLWYRRGQSCAYIGLSISPLARISIICTILFEFFDYTDHSICRHISSSHLNQSRQ